VTSKQKIITMTKLALYDKNEGSADRRIHDFYRHDYIYRKNMATRFFTGFGAVLIVALYWLRLFFIDGADLFDLDLEAHIRESILFILAVISVYSVVGTVQGTREYFLIQRRLNQYAALTQQLERINERNRKRAEKMKEEENREDHEGTAD
jgi:hypothetical protein